MALVNQRTDTVDDDRNSVESAQTQSTLVNMENGRLQRFKEVDASVPGDAHTSSETSPLEFRDGPTDSTTHWRTSKLANGCPTPTAADPSVVLVLESDNEHSDGDEAILGFGTAVSNGVFARKVAETEELVRGLSSEPPSDKPSVVAGMPNNTPQARSPLRTPAESGNVADQHQPPQTKPRQSSSQPANQPTLSSESTKLSDAKHSTPPRTALSSQPSGGDFQLPLPSQLANRVAEPPAPSKDTKLPLPSQLAGMDASPTSKQRASSSQPLPSHASNASRTSSGLTGPVRGLESTSDSRAPATPTRPFHVTPPMSHKSSPSTPIPKLPLGGAMSTSLLAIETEFEPAATPVTPAFTLPSSNRLSSPENDESEAVEITTDRSEIADPPSLNLAKGPLAHIERAFTSEHSTPRHVPETAQPEPPGAAFCAPAPRALPVETPPAGKRTTVIMTPSSDGSGRLVPTTVLLSDLASPLGSPKPCARPSTRGATSKIQNEVRLSSNEDAVGRALRVARGMRHDGMLRKASAELSAAKKALLGGNDPLPFSASSPRAQELADPCTPADTPSLSSSHFSPFTSPRGGAQPYISPRPSTDLTFGSPRPLADAVVSPRAPPPRLDIDGRQVSSPSHNLTKPAPSEASLSPSAHPQSATLQAGTVPSHMSSTVDTPLKPRQHTPHDGSPQQSTPAKERESSEQDDTPPPPMLSPRSGAHEGAGARVAVGTVIHQHNSSPPPLPSHPTTSDTAANASQLSHAPTTVNTTSALAASQHPTATTSVPATGHSSASVAHNPTSTSTSDLLSSSASLANNPTSTSASDHVTPLASTANNHAAFSASVLSGHGTNTFPATAAGTSASGHAAALATSASATHTLQPDAPSLPTKDTTPAVGTPPTSPGHTLSGANVHASPQTSTSASAAVRKQGHRSVVRTLFTEGNFGSALAGHKKHSAAQKLMALNAADAASAPLFGSGRPKKAAPAVQRGTQPAQPTQHNNQASAAEAHKQVVLATAEVQQNSTQPSACDAISPRSEYTDVTNASSKGSEAFNLDCIVNDAATNHASTAASSRSRLADPMSLRKSNLNVLKEGAGMKKSGGKGKARMFKKGGRRNWKRRWFVLDGNTGCLFYFASLPDSLVSRPLGYVNVQEAYLDSVTSDETTRDPNSTLAFRFVDKDVYFRADTVTDMEEWRELLASCQPGVDRLEKVVRQGWLLKKSHTKAGFAPKRRIWHLRYFILDGTGRLAYYRADQASSSYKLGEMYLSQCSLMDVPQSATRRDTSLCMRLSFVNREVLLAVSSASQTRELAAWKDAISTWQEDHAAADADQYMRPTTPDPTYDDTTELGFETNDEADEGEETHRFQPSRGFHASSEAEECTGSNRTSPANTSSYPANTSSYPAYLADASLFPSRACDVPEPAMSLPAESTHWLEKIKSGSAASSVYSDTGSQSSQIAINFSPFAPGHTAGQSSSLYSDGDTAVNLSKGRPPGRKVKSGVIGLVRPVPTRPPNGTTQAIDGQLDELELFLKSQQGDLKPHVPLTRDELKQRQTEDKERLRTLRVEEKMRRRRVKKAQKSVKLEALRLQQLEEQAAEERIAKEEPSGANETFTVAEVLDGRKQEPTLQLDEQLPMSKAFERLSTIEKGTAAVTDNQNCVVGSLSYVDMDAAIANPDMMELTICEFLTLLQEQKRKRLQVLVVSNKDIYADVMGVVMASDVHNVFVVDDDNRLVGSFSVSGEKGWAISPVLD